MRVGAHVGDRLRILVVYFERIILVYCVVLISMLLLQEIVASDSVFQALIFIAFAILWGMQGWVSFAIILTKPDIGKMVQDLFIGKLCYQKQAVTNDDTIEVTTTTNKDNGEREHEQERKKQRRNRVFLAFASGVSNYLSDDENAEEKIN